MQENDRLDELERQVDIAELQADTMEVAFHPDDATLATTKIVANKISNRLHESAPDSRSPKIARLFALRVRVQEVLRRMRSVAARGARRPM
ncbi:MAG TPA: hypothetical protein VIN06_14555 [Devosia sp.]